MQRASIFYLEGDLHIALSLDMISCSGRAKTTALILPI